MNTCKCDLPYAMYHNVSHNVTVMSCRGTRRNKSRTPKILDGGSVFCDAELSFPGPPLNAMPPTDILFAKESPEEQPLKKRKVSTSGSKRSKVEDLEN